MWSNKKTSEIDFDVVLKDKIYSTKPERGTEKRGGKRIRVTKKG